MTSDKEHRMNKAIEDALRVKPYVHADAEEAWNAFSQSINLGPPVHDTPFRISLWDIGKIAATLLVIIAIFSWMTRPVQFTKELITKAQGQSIQLFDGSTISAEHNTILHYPIREKDVVCRRVVLEKGMATFEVAKHELPFIVSVEHLDIVVTGTKFTIEKKPGEVIVLVREGIVQVTKNKDVTQTITLIQNDALLDCRGELFVSKDGQPYEQKTMFTYLSKLKAAEKLALEKKKLANEITDGEDPLALKYRMVDVIKFLDKKYKKELKFRKKRKLKSKVVVSLNLEKDLESLLKTMKQKRLIDFQPGKCAGCYIISPPTTPK